MPNHPQNHNTTHHSPIIAYLQTSNLEAEMARIKELGGQVEVERRDIEGFGSLGIFIDPMGSRVAFWQSERPS